METKWCYKCDTVKPHEAFGKNKRRKDGLQVECKACRNSAARDWYSTHQDVQVKRVKASKQGNRERAQEYVIEYLKSHPCVDCESTDIESLDFDHVIPSTKMANIADMVRDGKPLDRIRDEVAKCEVRCANCHRRRTGRQFGWYKVDR